MDWATIGLILTALGVGSVVGILVKGRVDKPLRDAQIADLFASTAKGLVEAQNQQMDEMQDDIRSEKLAREKDVERLEGVIRRLELEAAKKDEEADAMRDEITKLKEKNASKDKKILEQDAKIREQDEKINQLETENTSLRSRVGDLEKKLDELTGTPPGKN